jgi:integrase
MRFTDTYVRSLSLRESGQRDYYDDALPGFGLRVGKTAKTFFLVAGATTRRKRYTLGRYEPPRFTLAMAREKAKDIIARERLTKIESPRSKFHEALDVYYRTHLPTLRKTSATCVQQALDRHFVPKLGKMALEDIKRRDIAAVLDTMLHIPVAMHSTFRYLCAFLNWCVRRGYLETAPTDRMEPPKRPQSRTRVLSPDELVAVWRAAPDDDYGRIVRLCILSGQRRGQWAAVRREYISGDTITWPASLMKAGKPHTLPLTPAMTALLPDRIGYLFPNENSIPFGNWTRSKHRLTDESGVQGFRLHDLRRTWATMAAEELDIQPHIIEAVLAHAIGSQVARIYNRATYLEPMREALLAFEELLQALLSKKARGESVSNALTALTKSNHVARKDGKYVSGAG